MSTELEPKQWLAKEGYPNVMTMTFDNLSIILDRYASALKSSTAINEGDEIEKELCVTCGNELKGIIEIHRGTCNDCEK